MKAFLVIYVCWHEACNTLHPLQWRLGRDESNQRSVSSGRLASEGLEAISWRLHLHILVGSFCDVHWPECKRLPKLSFKSFESSMSYILFHLQHRPKALLAPRAHASNSTLSQVKWRKPTTTLRWHFCGPYVIAAIHEIATPSTLLIFVHRKQPSLQHSYLSRPERQLQTSSQWLWLSFLGLASSRCLPSDRVCNLQSGAKLGTIFSPDGFGVLQIGHDLEAISLDGRWEDDM